MAVYLDHAAATPLRPEVLDRMLPYLRGTFGNPSSPHVEGRRARLALDEARETMAAILGADPREIVFTSGGTESINLAIKGGAWAGKAMGHRIVTTAVEHRAVLDTCASLEKFGFEVVQVPVDRYSRLDPDALEAHLTERTCMVSLQLANNEVGTVADLASCIARVRAACKALVHIDAVQAASTMAVDVRTLGADMVSVAGHKLEGPRGIGVLWLRRGTAILPQVHGGAQERHRRAGTEDVAAAVGMAEAWRLMDRERDEVVPELARRRDRLWASLRDLGGVELTGHPIDRLPGLLSVLVPGLDGADLVHALDLAGLCCSTGSACTTGSTEPSHVLTAMGYPADEARGALRLSLGRVTTDADVAAATAILGEVITRQRQGVAALASAVPVAIAVQGAEQARMTERVLVAMSGGVDSSVAAALVARSGADAVGVWMRLHDGADSFSDVRRSCCSADAADDARRVASQLGIPFYVLDLEREFETGVMRPFADAYLSGRTPSPCIDCNSTVKFGALLGRARALYDADVVATGHYARVRHTHDASAPDGMRHDLLAGTDADKDQSYFLYGLSAAQLAHARFPVGDLSKPEVRAIASELGLVTAAKPESQELCFVPGGDIAGTLQRRAGWSPTPGTVVDADGRAAGVHAGAASYTVGQRGGVGVALGERQYVRRVDVRANVIHLGRRADLERASMTLESLSVTSGEPPTDPFRALVRVRHRAPCVPGWVMPDRDTGGGIRPDGWCVELDRPVWAPAPGQAAVLYAIDEPDRVLGGGRITEPAWRD